MRTSNDVRDKWSEERRGIPRTHLPETRGLWCTVFSVWMLGELELFTPSKAE